MYFSTFLNIIFVASLCFLTLNIEANYRHSAAITKRDPIDGPGDPKEGCLPSRFYCEESTVCCSQKCIRRKCA
jgi:hypothetical protein